MCHNILLPSKGSNEWSNIPFSTGSLRESAVLSKMFETVGKLETVGSSVGNRLIFTHPFVVNCCSCEKIKWINSF